MATPAEVVGVGSEAAVRIDLSVVAPVFNERENLRPLVGELSAALGATGMKWEIVLVDDGSTDGSSELIGHLARDLPQVRGVHLARNRGQTAAFDAGFKHARGRAVVTIDADLQNDPTDIPRLVAALDDYDVAVGYRQNREDDWVRRVSSSIANTFRNWVSGDDIIDTGCSLKAFRGDCLTDIKLFTGMHRFLPTLLKLEGHSVTQIPVKHRPRVAASSKYGVWNRAFSAFQDLLAVRWMKKRRLDYEVSRHEP